MILRPERRVLQLLSSLEATHLPTRHYRSCSRSHKCSLFQIIQAAYLHCYIHNPQHCCIQATQMAFLPSVSYHPQQYKTVPSAPAGCTAVLPFPQFRHILQQHCSSLCRAWLMPSALCVTILLPWIATGNFCSICQSCSRHRTQLLRPNQLCWYLHRTQIARLCIIVLM